MAAASPLQPSREQGRGCETKAKRASSIGEAWDGGAGGGGGAHDRAWVTEHRDSGCTQGDHKVRREMKSRPHCHKNPWLPSASAWVLKISGLFRLGVINDKGDLTPQEP